MNTFIPLFYYYQGFNEEIEKSKKNFTDAKKYIPIIKSLIKSANESAIEGKSFVDMSSKTANEAQAVFKQANELLTSNKQVIENRRTLFKLSY